ncbi:tRNA splicing endonuclease-like protein subunit [Zopfia rhizophila CBS 207.26]|uniref:tRNA splicing endonuclease-like protein subunit n=1 Tax=Zopfia rhizophila CBS 207.26 TaxID=1314779 RepID=A0A6A6EHI0_9PEZI|nr:tRNA splicing endonuclease-like protein subunit [Zopfia rhizophila CBS 207.26]
MADYDENLSHLRGPSAADIDLDDETQDFRFLSNLPTHDVKDLTLPKRGDKDFESHATSLQLSTLEASRQAMHNALSWPRIHTQKTHLLATYHPESNMAYVKKAKTQHFQTLGHFKAGKNWLLPEEALFMIERGSMDCRWPVQVEEGRTDIIVYDGQEENERGVPMSLQGAYAAFIGFEGGVGGKLTLEMYTVYAGLKRAGFIVFRAGDWDDERLPIQYNEQDARDGDKVKSGNWAFGFVAEIWRRLSRKETEVPADRLKCGPLLGSGLYRSYADIYRLLQVIPTRDRNAPPELILPPDCSNPFRITFDVYKTAGAGKFKKSTRGPPDYRIAVVNARETPVPTMAQLNDLLATTPYDPPNPNGNLYQKLRHGSRNVILAVVDNGIPSYIRVGDTPFTDEKLYKRLGRGPPRGKKSGRGRGRGRGG